MVWSKFEGGSNKATLPYRVETLTGVWKNKLNLDIFNFL
jgi:hypothetical protein